MDSATQIGGFFLQQLLKNTNKNFSTSIYIVKTIKSDKKLTQIVYLNYFLNSSFPAFAFRFF
jgi:hypothetical protein